MINDPQELWEYRIDFDESEDRKGAVEPSVHFGVCKFDDMEPWIKMVEIYDYPYTISRRYDPKCKWEIVYKSWE